MTLPIPANPIKLAKIAAARAAKGKVNRTENNETTPAFFASSSASVGHIEAMQRYKNQQKDAEAQRQATVGEKEVVQNSVVPRWYMGEYDSAKG